MAGLGDADKVVDEIHKARADLNNATSADHPLNHPNGKTPPWLITEFGVSPVSQKKRTKCDLSRISPKPRRVFEPAFGVNLSRERRNTHGV